MLLSPSVHDTTMMMMVMMIIIIVYQVVTSLARCSVLFSIPMMVMVMVAMNDGDILGGGVDDISRWKVSIGTALGDDAVGSF